MSYHCSGAVQCTAGNACLCMPAHACVCVYVRIIIKISVARRVQDLVVEQSRLSFLLVEYERAATHTFYKRVERAYLFLETLKFFIQIYTLHMWYILCPITYTPPKRRSMISVWLTTTHFRAINSNWFANEVFRYSPRRDFYVWTYQKGGNCEYNEIGVIIAPALRTYVKFPKSYLC